MAYHTLKLDISGTIATITLNRPEKLNAISGGMIDELLLAFAEVEAGSANILILTGTGKAFCSGMDLDELKAIATQSPAKHLEDSHHMARLYRRIWSYSKPTIAAVNGAAIAGGCGLATLCDFTISANDATFGYPEVHIGFIPAIVSVFLTRQIGEKKARDLLLTGRIISAAEAHGLGLLKQIVPSEELMNEARTLARALLACSAASLFKTKKLLCSLSASELDRELELAIAAGAEIRSTEDFREGVAAFLEKRRPSLGLPLSDYSETLLRVRYAETDKMGIVYYANYYIYFEIGRVEYMRERGVNYREMELQDDSFIVVAESKCRYRRPARYDDPLRIRTRVLGAKRRTIHFGYEIFHDETGELLATGETIHVVCDSNGRPKALPEKYRRYFDFPNGE